jgi:hypothetical protein
MTPTKFQENLLAAIKHKMPDELSLAKDIAPLFNCTKSTVYKKLRGDILFSMEEAIALIEYFKLSADTLIYEQHERLIFQYSAFVKPHNSPGQYMDTLLAQLETVAQIPNVNIWYATYEIPIFYYMLFPELIAFKLYVWSRVNWNISTLANKPFDPECFLSEYPEIETQRKRMLALYTQLPSREFWPLHVLDHTLSQIRTCFHSGLLDGKHVAALLCSRIQQMIDLIENMAINGRKKSHPEDDNSTPFELYFNEIAYSNNTILIRSNQESLSAFATLDNPNFIHSNDARLLQNIETWMESIRSKTIKISQEGERFRHFFINTLRKRLAELQTELDL